ncbi:hypothetical protein JK203_11410 [Gluconobacter cerinus]|uniref:hypothetical protein n=1 Tax=Gluconobacter cerinus TaxID=38307 RepID=UPI001B8C4F0B|nr:hypothetical protein [Gluconobacter cerinus]MBS1041445.1 hypothetical protein [Gluconobacter cerinus]MBS1048033.1 hypothetical protein [Gluconobacter cerinus]
MKRVTFTDRCDGIGSVYNKGDVAVFPDGVADAIVAAKKGTAEAMPDLPPSKVAGKKDAVDPPVDPDPGKQDPKTTPENGKS